MRFCVKCGRDEGSVAIVRHLCVDCYLELRKGDLLPGSVSLVYCPSCGSYRVGGEWISLGDVGGDERVVLAYIVERGLRIPGDVSSAGVEDLRVVRTDYGEVVEAIVRLVIGGSSYMVRGRVALHRGKRLCPACYKIRGKGYEAVVQIRGFPSLSKRVLRSIEEKLDRLPESLKGSIAEVEFLREGIDLKLVSRRSAQSLASILKREFGGRVIETEEGGSRATNRAGRKPRLVISLRIPCIEEGSYIRINGLPYIVEKVSNENITLIDRDGKRVTMPLRDIVKSW